MIFPKSLGKNERDRIEENLIPNCNLIFMRHKPGSVWKDKADFPEYSQISSDQSFNWGAFSIPLWVRFNDRGKYLEEYGVTGVTIKAVRESHKYNGNLPPNLYGLHHVPVKLNYSHSELYKINIDNFQKRVIKEYKQEFRYHLKQRNKLKIFPNEEINYLRLRWHYLLMYRDRITFFLKRFMIEVFERLNINAQ